MRMMDAVMVTGTSEKSRPERTPKNRTEFMIGALSDMTACSPETIRHYERIGLLPPAMRSQSGRRIYSMADAERLSFIRQARTFGFGLGDIAGLLAVVNDGTDVCAKMRGRALERLRKIRREIEVLEQAARELEKAAASCSDASTDCAIDQSLSTGSLRR